MKKIILAVLMGSISSSAHAGVEMFAGSFLSGPNQGPGCESGFQIRVKHSPQDEDIEFVTQFRNNGGGTTGENVFRVLNKINKGWVPWRYDWGDGVATGKQITTFDGTQLQNTVEVGFLGLRTLTFSLKLQGAALTTLRTDTGSAPVTCRYERAL